MNDRLEYRRSLGLPKDTEEEWACSNCGKLGLERSCDCTTDVVCRISGEKHEHAVKTAPNCADCPPPGYPTDKTRCTECPRLKSHIREIGGWCADILNTERGAVGYELREFANDVHGKVHEALVGKPELDTNDPPSDDLAAALRANAKEPWMAIGGRPFAIEAASAIDALTAERDLYRLRWLSCVTQEEAERLRDAMNTARSLLRGLPASKTATDIDKVLAYALGEP